MKSKNKKKEKQKIINAISNLIKDYSLPVGHSSDEWERWYKTYQKLTDLEDRLFLL